MGKLEVQHFHDTEDLRLFTRHLLNDLRAFEQMLGNGSIESGVRRVGAEQEMFLVDNTWRPKPCALQILERLDDPSVTTELGSFNLEFNLEPAVLGGNCLRHMEEQLRTKLALVRDAAHQSGAEVVLSGILPTLQKSDLTLENMTPIPRYHALNDAMGRLRGSDYEFRLVGTDELIIKHDSIMLEACNSSFQVHFQVSPKEFARLYNIAQAVAGPVLAVAVYSPLLFGKRLWEETRIALFQQAVDTRSTTHHMQERQARVSFGNAWVQESAVEIYREDIARLRVLIGSTISEDPFEVLADGKVPQLQALQLHNGTVYRWTRPCYGITDGKPHLRIENRVLPSGPTPTDEVANAAFWFGLISAFLHEYGDITTVMDFDDAKTNFLAASRRGLKAQFRWIDKGTIPACDLLQHSLVPLAREGLRASNIDEDDITHYMGIIEERVLTEQTGSHWMLDSLTSLKDRGTSGERLAALTAFSNRMEKQNRPVHEWDLATLQDAGGWERNYLRVDQYMTTDVFTVHEHELIDLVACLMDWAHIRHVPVEDNEGKIVGLVSYRSLLRVLSQDSPAKKGEAVPVRDIMQPAPITISPETRTMDAIELMRSNRVACLPVVKDGRLVGIITERDFLNVARNLLEEKLSEE